MTEAEVRQKKVATKTAKTDKASKTEKIKDTINVEVAVVPVPVEIVAEVPQPVTDIVLSFEERTKEILSAFDAQVKELKLLKSSLKMALFVYQKESREASKKSKKKSRKPSNGHPHGFAKKALLSNTLCEILSLPIGQEMSSPSVTRLIANYVKENELYIPELNNKSVFKCDAKLLKLLGEPQYPAKRTDPTLGINHSYWNLQKTMKDNGHFTRIATV